jgi:hypothetical protein
MDTCAIGDRAWVLHGLGGSRSLLNYSYLRAKVGSILAAARAGM